MKLLSHINRSSSNSSSNEGACLGQTSIGVYDSGAGGRRMGKAIQQVLPSAKVHLHLDYSHQPLGEKPADEIIRIVLHGCRSLADRTDLDVLVLG